MHLWFCNEVTRATLQACPTTARPAPQNRKVHCYTTTLHLQGDNFAGLPPSRLVVVVFPFCAKLWCRFGFQRGNAILSTPSEDLPLMGALGLRAYGTRRHARLSESATAGVMVTSRPSHHAQRNDTHLGVCDGEEHEQAGEQGRHDGRGEQARAHLDLRAAAQRGSMRCVRSFCHLIFFSKPVSPFCRICAIACDELSAGSRDAAAEQRQCAVAQSAGSTRIW